MIHQPLGGAQGQATDIYNEGGHRNYKKYNGFCNKLEGYLKTKKKTRGLKSLMANSD
jgi:ATP-dependent protease ClpP protease subunit